MQQFSGVEISVGDKRENMVGKRVIIKVILFASCVFNLFFAFWQEIMLHSYAGKKIVFCKLLHKYFTDHVVILRVGYCCVFAQEKVWVQVNSNRDLSPFTCQS